tara:strand:+ start:488 stop:1618 length:1131 start_codon:yes stop_codon:yes gene_type:complete
MNSIKSFKTNAWNQLVIAYNNPFYEWHWLFALENSKSVSNEFGWQPLYISIWRDNDLIGAAPLFLKNHSFGEFIFDHNFANLASHLSLNYYPKLIGMSPYSPIKGYRFFIAPKEDHLLINKLIMNAIDDFAKNNNILSCNFLYTDPKWNKISKEIKCIKWKNKQSLWEWKGEKDFNDYLSRFNSNQRKNIKKERNYLNLKKISFSSKEGDQITKELMKSMHIFYELHCSKWGAWGSKYLTEDFFLSLASEEIKNNILIFSAHMHKSNSPIAMSMFVKGKNIIWGRYWGSVNEIKNLHFELCYYQPIEWSIKNKIQYFDPGAGGNQKRRRGFKAVETTSLHKWYIPKVSKIITEWIDHANIICSQEIKNENNSIPFK